MKFIQSTWRCRVRDVAHRVIAQAQGKLNVIATTEDLAAIAREVGGDRITVESIARGYQDPHFVEAKPSFILKLQKADILVTSAASWRSAGCRRSSSRAATRRSRRRQRLPRCLRPGAILDIPQGQITRAMGDVHPLGNPHYWLDPENGKAIAQGDRRQAVAASAERPGLSSSSGWPTSRRASRGREALGGGDGAIQGHEGRDLPPLVPELRRALRLDVIGYVEPRPGIPPSPQHTLDLINEMKRQNVKLVLVEPYFDLEDAELHRPGDRRRGAGDAALGRRREGGHRLLHAVRLRHQPAGRRAEEGRRRSRTEDAMDSACWQFLAAPFVASLILTGIHAYLGVHVVERGVIFVDLSLAQIAALGAAIAILLPDHGRRSARAGRLLDQPRLHLHRGGRVLDDSRPPRAHSAGGDHRHLLRRGLGGGDPRDEQGDVGERAPQGHARRQHPRGVVARSRRDRRRCTARSASSTTSSASSSWRFRWTTAAPSAQGLSVRFWDFLFYASFGFVVTSSVAIAGVLLVFCYLIVPSVGGDAVRRTSGKRLAIGWTMGTVVSALGVYFSLVLDLPTGATIVCTFGIVLALMAALRPLIRRTSEVGEVRVPARNTRLSGSV